MLWEARWTCGKCPAVAEEALSRPQEQGEHDVLPRIPEWCSASPFLYVGAEGDPQTRLVLGRKHARLGVPATVHPGGEEVSQGLAAVPCPSFPVFSCHLAAAPGATKPQWPAGQITWEKKRPDNAREHTG